ncbi:MAG TPA: hypothetical protein VMV31_03015 [Terriglobales bacterium]|nr:hypothetical protein [Terriglobales bacterium]
MASNSTPMAGSAARGRPRAAKRALKTAVRAIARVLALPGAAAAGFGRVAPSFQFFGQLLALVPGLPGDYLRAAYYGMTLRACSPDVRISFGTFFARSASSLGRGAYVGAFCVLGDCDIGERTQIASHVQILSGRHQHGRGADGAVLGADSGRFRRVSVGEDCWIGAAAIVMADVGARSTIGAGAVVTRRVPPDTVAVGNPARPLPRARAAGPRAEARTL